jgi:serine/threonine-protein kinase CLA4
LHDIISIERADARSHCLVLETSLHKRYLLSFDNDEELYSWQDAIYSRSGLAGISNPVNFVHNIHIGIDGVSGDYTVRTTD